MFNFLKKKKAKGVFACVSGTTKALNKVTDEAFSKGLIGSGIAITPEDTTVVSPVEGVITMLFPTKHAVGIKRVDGVEILLHIGIDTVNLKGEGFVTFVETGQHVKVGDPLITVDITLLKEKGIDTDIMCIITNPNPSVLQYLVADNTKVVAGKEEVFVIEDAK